MLTRLPLAARLAFAIAIATSLALGLAACGSDIDPPRPEGKTMSPETFTAVLAELGAARVELLPDTAAYRGRTAQILALHGVTVEDFRAFAAGYGGNEEVVQAAYEAERARLDSLFGTTPFQATTPPDTAF